MVEVATQGVRRALSRVPLVVLLAEDDPGLRALFTLILQGAGHRVMSAPDGLEALEAAARQMPDLLVSDLDMPRLDGAGLAHRLLDRHPAMKVLIVSGGDERRALGHPFEPKPVSAARLLERVREVTGS